MPVILLNESHRVPDEHFKAAARILRRERAAPDIETAGEGEILEWRPDSIMQHDDGWGIPPATQPGSPVWLWGHYGPNSESESGIMFLARTQLQVTGIGACLDRQGIVYQSQDDVAGDWETRLAVMRALDMLDGVRPEATDSESESLDVTNDRTVTPGEASRELSATEARSLIRHSDAQHFEDGADGRDECLDMITRLDMEGVSVPVSALNEHVSRKYWFRYGSGRASITNLIGLSDLDERAMSAAWERYGDREFTVDALADGTRLWTIHASKGAENSDVVLFTGITQRTRRDIDAHDDMAENEARCWYVGLTRSSARLHIRYFPTEASAGR